MEMYQPGAIVMCCGADSLSGDRLGCFNLSMQVWDPAVESVDPAMHEVLIHMANTNLTLLALCIA